MLYLFSVILSGCLINCKSNSLCFYYIVVISSVVIYAFASLELAIMSFLDIMEWNAWIKEFVDKVKADERMKKYLEGGPAEKRIKNDLEKRWVNSNQKICRWMVSKHDNYN